MSERTSCCAAVAIERARRLPVEEFHHRYLSGVGKPVIVTGEMDSWPARSMWTFEMFKSRYGSEGVDVSVWPGDKFRKMMTLGDYIDYLHAPGERSPGFWIDPKTKYPRADPPEPVSNPLYLSGWGAFHLHPELLDEVRLSPEFVEDWLPLLPPAFRDVLDKATRYFSAGVLIGPAGATADLHDDFLHSHAYLAQIAGTKRCTLFSPEDSANVYDGAVDPQRPDLEKFPRMHFGAGRDTFYPISLVAPRGGDRKIDHSEL